ncbi:MAG: ABC transporter ATP-binding protein [Holophagales bacterium]|nr:ABC transporter ATP-binding protein [Holophagales bacterium]
MHRTENRTKPETVARISGAAKRYGEITALHGLDLTLTKGEVLALLGPNGAGKTTTVSLLLGALRPDVGEVQVLGGDPADRPQRERMGAMLQTAGLPPALRVAEHLELFRSYYPHPLPGARLLEMAGLEGLEQRRYDALSGGQQQRLHFALALAGDPDLLFLDEPSTGLDVAARRRLWQVVRVAAADGRTVLLTTHHLDEADALADRVAVLHGGHLLASGSPAEIKSRVAGRCIRCVTRLDPSFLRALPGVDAVSLRGSAVEILTGASEAVVRRLLELDPDLSDLEVKGAGLEQAFLSLTGGSPDSATPHPATEENAA